MSTIEKNKKKNKGVKYERDPLCFSLRLNKIQEFLLFFINPVLQYLKVRKKVTITLGKL